MTTTLADKEIAHSMRPGSGDAAPTPVTRFHALDCVRATAMLLGIFYHLPIAMMGGGFGQMFGMGPPGGQSPKTSIDNWLHSFRMALFFLLSGFFANMVLGKYGIRRYLARRWWRIGAPLFVALFAFGLLRSFVPSVVAPSFGGMMDLAPPATGQPTGGFFPPAAGGMPGQMPWGPGAGFPPNAGAMPGQMPWGPRAGFPPGAAGFPPMPGPTTTAAQPFTPPAGMAMPPMPEMMPMPSRAVARRLFGKYAGNFMLEHLWFLWYLLLFVTAAPLVAGGLRRVSSKSLPMTDRLGERLIRGNILALVLGLATIPALLHAKGFAGWSLMNPGGFLGSFPDFLWQYFPDLPFYFVYFLAGWWFYRLRGSLDDVARPWLWNLSLGITAFAVSQALSNKYSMNGTDANGWIRLGGFALYALGSAYSAFGLIGLFQRYLDRPTKLGRYFTDTMLWVYLVQLAIIPHVLPWIEPSRTSWWEASFAGMVVVTGIALVLFELFIRRTPLVHIFGPPMRKKRLEPAVAGGSSR